MSTVKVKFLPHNQEIEVEAGTSVIRAAMEADGAILGPPVMVEIPLLVADGDETGPRNLPLENPFVRRRLAETTGQAYRPGERL